MSKLHLIFGIALFIVFLVTGRFMRTDFPDKQAIEQEFRLLMRSRHIYILLSSLMHILLGVYLQIDEKAWRKYLQFAGSALLILGSIFLVYAFFHETYSAKHFTDASRFGLYATLAGTAFHLFSRFR